MKYKRTIKILFMIVPSAVLLLLMFVISGTPDKITDYKPTDKPVLLLVTNDTCEDCEKQKEVWTEYKNGTPNMLVGYKRININNAVYSDVADVFGITGFPAVVGVSPSGEVLYSTTGYHGVDDIKSAAANTIDNELALKVSKEEKAEEGSEEDAE